MDSFWVHHLDPIAFSLGPISVRWYGLAYAVGFIFAWRYGMALAAKGYSRLTSEHIDYFVLYAVAGVVIGGRLGQVFLYYPAYYLSNPLEIFMIWKGGMAFHGGLIGVLVAIYFYTKKHGISFFELSDNLAITTPFALLLGRIANFINGELAGRVTDFPLAVIFPSFPDEPRHASQLYQAGLEGLIPLIILLIMVRMGKLKRIGFTSGLFLVLYAIGRMIGEAFREPEILSDLLPSFMTYGMVLSVPMLIAGMIIIQKSQPINPIHKSKG